MISIELNRAKAIKTNNKLGLSSSGKILGNIK